MLTESALPQKQIDEFVSRMRQAAGQNLQSLILYGSAAGGEFHPEFSNLNLLCILREITFAKLSDLSRTAEWWTHHKHPAPLVMTQEELERSADVFSIELLDMKQHHHVLFGEDVFSALMIPMQWHRAQLEYELREKLILLRERILLAADDRKQLLDLMLRSLGTFTTLFRHALIALAEPVPATRREAVQQLAARTFFDPLAFLLLLDIREKRADPREQDVKDTAAHYLQAIQQVVAAVDKMLDSPGRIV
jgi:hypothetical protein